VADPNHGRTGAKPSVNESSGTRRNFFFKDGKAGLIMRGMWKRHLAAFDTPSGIDRQEWLRLARECGETPHLHVCTRLSLAWIQQDLPS
jgi:hypothetical protein